MNVLVVGDLHGEWAVLNKLMQKKQPDVVLCTGDFGWWPKLSMSNKIIYSQKSWKHDGLKIPEGTKVYFCDGNHEDHWDLEKRRGDTYDIVELYPRCFYCPRGSTLQLPDGRNVLFMGGADSIDKSCRTLGIDWFPEEVISYADVERALSLETPIDILISHTVPLEWVPDVCRGEKFSDPSRPALSAILKKFQPKLWYSGHWHHEAQGKHKDTYWYSLDYPGHRGRWWRGLD